ncbi:signal transduction histidine kinase [Leptospira ryugenii]|uniref:Sensory/regulatory protein RpfC n=1 Tax=Leptospira ryugenii TaxID=1917863 RepID=A0A2P2E196_9LEPT|nr:PAS domain S-box protein [Leptospira ryugenii]GBF50644.1 signal transduction histidine kinase [Leptospira ryugenii]
MKAPDIPSNETERLRDLHSFAILGAEEEADFDFLTQMAARICGTKVALVSLVTEDKQWFLSHHGLEERETSREVSFCGHAINLPEEAFIVQDARKDERFFDNPLVTGPLQVIFYAGIPLLTEKGHAIGTLCVLDDQPKALDEEQIQLLRSLSRQVIHLLELRRANQNQKTIQNNLEKYVALLEETERTNQIGSWEVNLDTGKVLWTEEVYHIHEVGHEHIPSVETGINFYHPDDRAIITTAIQTAIEDNSSFDVVCRFITAKGNQKWVRSTGKLLNRNLVGSFQDITELKASELKFKGIFNSTYTFTSFLNQRGEILDINETALTTAGIQKQEVLGKPLWDTHWWNVSSEIKNNLRNNFSKALSGERIVYEVANLISHGQVTTVIFSLKPIYDEKGYVEFVLAEARPIQDIIDTRNRYYSVLEGTNVGTWEWNVQTGETIFNERWAEIVGYSLEELQPISIQTWAKLVHPDDLAESNRLLQHCFERKSEFYEFEARMLHKDGSWVWVHDRGKVFSWTEDGKPLMMFGTHQDITKRKKFERTLRRTKDFLDQTSKVARVGGWELDLQNQELIWSEVTAEIHEVPLGYVPNPESSLHFYKEGVSRERIKEVFHDCVEHGVPYDEELEFVTYRGKTIWVRTIGIPEMREGRCLRIYGTFQDITGQKKAQEDLKNTLAQVELFRRVIEDSGDCFYMLDLSEQGRMVYVNEAAERHFGARKEDIYKWRIRDWDPVFPVDRLEEWIDDLSRGRRMSFESQHRIASGRLVPVEITANFFQTTDGKRLAYGWFSDISKRLQIQKEINDAKIAAEAASKAKSEFLANMSHEIRTPLNGVLGFANLLNQTELSPIQRKHVEIINASGNALLDIINDILDFSKIEAGMMKLESIQCDILELFETAVDIVKYSAGNKNLEILLDIEQDIPRFAFVDPIRLKQVLVNLLGNAVKFTEEGEVELKVRFQKTEGERGVFSIAIRDTGIGISDEQKQKLFKAFSQADSSVTRKFGGTGLGLIISNMIAKEMKTEIKLESTLGEGSTFSFAFETNVLHGEARDLTALSKIKRCLIVDDNAHNRYILEKTLESWKLATTSVARGIDAIEKLKEDSFDVLICDYHMPSLDGLATVSEIRNTLGIPKERLPIILLHSSSDDAELQKQCDLLGIRFQLTKPVKANDLFSFLCAIHSPNPQLDMEKPKQDQAKRSYQQNVKFKILAVEDVDTNLLLVKFLLKNLVPNAKIIEAHNGREAVDAYLLERPDLVLMDVQMPVMDGIEATKLIRSEESKTGSHVPIVALTAAALKEEESLCKGAGMDDFLTKPLDKAKLKAVIERYLFSIAP